MKNFNQFFNYISNKAASIELSLKGIDMKDRNVIGVISQDQIKNFDYPKRYFNAILFEDIYQAKQPVQNLDNDAIYITKEQISFGYCPKLLESAVEYQVQFIESRFKLKGVISAFYMRRAKSIRLSNTYNLERDLQRIQRNVIRNEKLVKQALSKFY